MTGPAAGISTRPEHSAGMPRTALAIGCVAWLLAISALVVQALSGVDLLIRDLMFIVVDAVVAVVYGTVGPIILSRRPHVVGWLTSLAGVGAGLAALGGGWANLASTQAGVPELLWLQIMYGTAWVPGTVGLFVLVPWFVRDHPMTPGAWAGVSGGVLAIVAMLAAPLDDPRPTLVGVVAMGLVTAAATWVRHRRGPVAERRGLGVLAIGCAVMALSFVPLLFTWAEPQVVLALPLTHLACQALYPAAILVSVLRNRMWGLDLGLSRATIVALLTVGLSLTYSALVVVSGYFVSDGLVPQIIAAVGVVVLAQPLRAWLGRRVNRLVYGAGANPARAALALGRRLSGASTAEELLEGVTAGVGQTLRLGSVALTSPDGRTPVTRWGSPTHDPEVVPVVRAGTTIARLAVTARPGERLDSRTRDALEQLVHVVAAGVALAHSAQELERARDAVTRARLEERRVIRRELHDGMGPWLSGLRLGLQGARNTLTADPDAAAEVLQALQVETERRVQDVRELSRSLLPPVLDELGLVAALDELVQRQAAAGFTVRLDADRADGLPPPVAAAAYAIASEAVINAFRHSGADSCTLRVRVDASQLQVECVDAGAGFAVGSPAGVGLRSMRERAEELEGGVDVESGSSGTRVTARLPIPAAALQVSGVTEVAAR